jgi:glyoxylase-like metal-dependent hydrolase (beta-lactamase superfamily II)
MNVIYQDPQLEIRRTVTGPFANNTYILVCRQTGEGVIIDTPAEPEVILKAAEGITVKALLMTHCHGDHVAGHTVLKSHTKAPAAVHPHGAVKLPLLPDLLLRHGDTFTFGQITLQVLHTPGHTPEGLCFLWGRVLLSGDSLFPHGPGRTWSSQDFRQLVQSIQEKLFVLPDDTWVLPGHGQDTVLGREKEEFRIFQERPHPPDLCGDVLWLTS